MYSIYRRNASKLEMFYTFKQNSRVVYTLMSEHFTMLIKQKYEGLLSKKKI